VGNVFRFGLGLANTEINAIYPRIQKFLEAVDANGIPLF
jgi:hypothetical protein